MVEIRRFANAKEIAASAAAITAETLAKALKSRENATLVLARRQAASKGKRYFGKRVCGCF